MNKLLIVLSILFCHSLFSQNLECKDFKEGVFYIVSELDGVEYEYEISRTNNVQEEYYDDNNTLYTTLSWIDDCTYILKFNEDLNGEIDEVSKKINNMGGIYVQKKYIEGECFYFKSVCAIDEENYMRVDGRICKEEI